MPEGTNEEMIMNHFQMMQEIYTTIFVQCLEKLKFFFLMNDLEERKSNKIFCCKHKKIMKEFNGLYHVWKISKY